MAVSGAGSISVALRQCRMPWPRLGVASLHLRNVNGFVGGVGVTCSGDLLHFQGAGVWWQAWRAQPVAPEAPGLV
jgi:hypothetical protein